MTCHSSHIFVLDADFDDKKLILINFLDRKSEVKQLKIFSETSQIVAKLQLTQNSHMVFSGDINFF